MFILYILLAMLVIFAISTAIVLVAGYLIDKAEHVIDGLDGEYDEDDGLEIVDEFVIPEDSKELAEFKEQLLDEYRQDVQEFVVEDLKDGVLGNLKQEKF